MLHCEARRPARRDAAGRFVPPGNQDPRLWSAELIRTAKAQMHQARRLAGADPTRFGRFPLEAAIQSAHASRATTGTTPWPAVAALYAALLAVAPTVGAAVGRAAAIAEARGPAAGLEALAAIDPDAVVSYRPYWALRAHLVTRTGAPAGAAWDRAIGLAEDAAVRAFVAAKAGRG
jgi:RNA polymerase sigma-70 factor (ECF subfamily)